MPLSPKMRFKLNRILNRWEAWKGNVRQTTQAVTAEQKMCPSCRALVSRGLATCPYCGQRLKVWEASPVGRMARRTLPGMTVTSWLILANVVMFVIEYAASGSANWLAGPSPQATLRLGVTLPLPYILATGQYWRWITACFLHAGLLHIGFNMYGLYIIGPMVESFYGGEKYFTLYMATGIIGYIVSGYIGYESLGASGAIFGLLGVLIAYGTVRKHSAMGRQVRTTALIWAGFSLYLAYAIPGVDNAAHIGGLISGFLLGMVIGDDPPLTESQIARWRVISGVMVGVVAVAFYLMATSHGLVLRAAN